MFNTKRTDGISTGVVIWQSKNTQVAQGGFTLDDASFVEGTVIPAGTPVGFDEATRLAKVYKSGVAQASATGTATTYKVLKGNLFVVGMTVKSGASAGQVITAIDRANVAYDEITTAATLGVTVATGAAIYVDDDGLAKVKGLLYASVEVGGNGLADITVVLRGTVYARRITPIPATVKALLPLIIFSESF